MDIDCTHGRTPMHVCFNCSLTTHLACNCTHHTVHTVAGDETSDAMVCTMATDTITPTISVKEKKKDEPKANSASDCHDFSKGGITYIRNGITHLAGYGDEYQDF
jgi:hypothetical protein